ncbi:MAG: CHAT domain-containing protein [Deltaproteobacteria bacterium]|nr:CHAT domain-containing protein [Deltaproteobacteria bacterium]
MEKEKKEKQESASNNLAEILRERERLDHELKEKFRKELSILFTDVCGYTKYVETKGDISGRAMIQRHNDIVFPVVAKHGGVVVKTIGDAVMATFSTPLAAVKASMDIQKGLHEHNRKSETSEKIYVKIGINKGEALMDGVDVFGDAVNVASRIQSQAGKDQILVSQIVYEEVGGSEDILCRLHGTVSIKGKAEPIKLYRVVWQEEEVVFAEPKVRTHGADAGKKTRAPLKLLQLEITREENRLKIGAYEQIAGETSTVRHYEEIPVSLDKIKVRCHEIVETLNSTNRNGRLTREVLVKLREIGQVFTDELFTPDVKEKVAASTADHLILNLDDQLVHVPWELLHDGQKFLCQRFNMGRLVKTRQTILPSRRRLLARPLKMLILADPRGDLNAARREGVQIRDHVDKDRDFINVSLRSDGITPDFIKEKIRNFDFVHFAGHADYNQLNPGESGWQLSSGMIKAHEITRMAGTAAMPALIFSNACQSARTEEWAVKERFHDEIFGLANAFILAGVKHYVGTFWEILDEPGSHFALEFYKNVLSGKTVGEAMKLARLESINKYGEETIVWASYLLYGDPTSNYMEQVREIEMQDEPEPAAALQRTEVRAPEEVADSAGKKTGRKKALWWTAATVIIALVAFLLWGYPGFLKYETAKHQNAALASYEKGNFEEALNICRTLGDKNTESRLARLIPGNIYLREGKLDAAEAAYQAALQAEDGTDLQKAEALIGLGRIASLRKKTDDSLKYYRLASEAAPGSGAGYMSQALLLDDKGQYKEALDLLGKAQKASPDDRLLAAVTRETQGRASLAQDQEKQQRIDKMVKELLETMKRPQKTVPSDGWTSPPMTVWMMDFGTKGYSLQEGEGRLLDAGIADRLIQHGRVRLVERALLDKLLGELKLGTSKLIDGNTALSLGKILAARLLVSGEIIHSGPQSQISVRLIETETGRVTAAISESFGSNVPPSVLTDKVSGRLLERLNGLYPLRGKVSEVRGKEIFLNIGQKEGVNIGQVFRVIDRDLSLEVVAVQTETSMAKIAAGKGQIAAGLRVENLSSVK